VVRIRGWLGRYSLQGRATVKGACENGLICEYEGDKEMRKLLFAMALASVSTPALAITNQFDVATVPGQDLYTNDLSTQRLQAGTVYVNAQNRYSLATNEYTVSSNGLYIFQISDRILNVAGQPTPCPNTNFGFRIRRGSLEVTTKTLDSIVRFMRAGDTVGYKISTDSTEGCSFSLPIHFSGGRL
jgi:hypothetical protein